MPWPKVKIANQKHVKIAIIFSLKKQTYVYREKLYYVLLL